MTAFKPDNAEYRDAARRYFKMMSRGFSEVASILEEVFMDKAKYVQANAVPHPLADKVKTLKVLRQRDEAAKIIVEMKRDGTFDKEVSDNRTRILYLKEILLADLTDGARKNFTTELESRLKFEEMLLETSAPSEDKVKEKLDVALKQTMALKKKETLEKELQDLEERKQAEVEQYQQKLAETMKWYHERKDQIEREFYEVYEQLHDMNPRARNGIERGNEVGEIPIS